jgi:hypothetical protein
MYEIGVDDETGRADAGEVGFAAGFYSGVQADLACSLVSVSCINSGEIFNVK